MSQIPFSSVKNKRLVVEEKCDGANCGISFDADGTLLLQSRGHYLRGGYGERHYELLKTWANVHSTAFYNVLGSRYIMYGEWMYAKHAVFYDRLPHYFLEFDIFDRERGVFLDTDTRKRMISSLPVVSVPVLADGSFRSLKELLSLLGTSNYISERHIEVLRESCIALGLDADKICGETDSSVTMEGLYLKLEENGIVTDRLKFVRASYSQHVFDSLTPWVDRPIIPNKLTRPLDELFLPELKS